MNFEKIADENIEQAHKFIINVYSENENIQRAYSDKRYMKSRIQANIEKGVIAYEKETIKGLITIITPTDDNYWNIGILFVEEGERRNGIATKLLEQASLLASKNMEKIKISAMINGNNISGKSFFEKVQYVQEGKLKGIEEKDDTYIYSKIM